MIDLLPKSGNQKYGLIVSSEQQEEKNQTGNIIYPICEDVHFDLRLTSAIGTGIFAFPIH